MKTWITRSATVLTAALTLTAMVGCSSSEDGADPSAPSGESLSCSGIEEVECETLRDIESTVDLVDLGEDPCELGFEYSDEGFDQVGVECADGHVTKLALHGAEMTEVPSGMFTGLSELEALSLGGNKITEIDPSAFDGLGKLQHLFLFENLLTELPSDLLAGLPELQIFTIERNQLFGVPTDIFSENPLLEIVQLNENRLEELTADHFAGLDNLTTLFLGNNALTSVDSDLFVNLPALYEVTLNSNQIAEFPAGLFSTNEALGKMALNSNEATYAEGILGGEERELETVNIKCNGPIPADFAMVTVSDEATIDQAQSEQTNLGEFLSQSSMNIEDNC